MQDPEQQQKKAKVRFTWKVVLGAIGIWGFMVVEILVYAGKIPKTSQGWLFLIFLGPLSYVFLAMLGDALFGGRSKKAPDDKPVA